MQDVWQGDQDSGVGGGAEGLERLELHKRLLFQDNFPWTCWITMLQVTTWTVDYLTPTPSHLSKFRSGPWCDAYNVRTVSAASRTGSNLPSDWSSSSQHRQPASGDLRAFWNHASASSSGLSPGFCKTWIIPRHTTGTVRMFTGPWELGMALGGNNKIIMSIYQVTVTVIYMYLMLMYPK